ncbi:MAG: BTAD domain-containing putative transcriptional regulator [Gemmatimonadaceae bacterium]
MSLLLKVFGGLSLVDSASSATRVTRRHRLAVLAVLASTDRAVSRERLLKLIWPDSNEEAGRHALGQVLYGLRQDVALGELVSGATDLSLNRSHITCDLWDFRERIKTGDRRGAIDLYTGPFLDGFQLPNADGFERWCEEERRSLATIVASAIEALANEATAIGDATEAANWWRRLAAGDPLSSRIALNYMKVLVATGDRVAAVQHARVHSSLVRAELETDADASLIAYAEELRTASTAISAPRAAISNSAASISQEPAFATSASTPSNSTPTVAASAPPNDTATNVDTKSDPRSDAQSFTSEPMLTNSASMENRANAEVSTTGNATAARKSNRVLLSIVAIAAVALAAMSIQQYGKRNSPDRETNGIPVVAVLPFVVTGDSTRAFLGEALSTLLTSRLDAPGVLRTLESNAVLNVVGKHANDAESRVQTLGANLVVSGTIVVLGDQLEMKAELRGIGEPASRAVRATSTGAADSLFSLADKLGAALLVAREGRPLGSSALGGTTSVPALKALLAGERALREWQLFDAITAYKAAIAIDSTYAFAWYRLTFTEGWAGVSDSNAKKTQATAFRLSKQLPERYALLAEAVAARSRNDVSAERDLLTLVQRYPDDADAWSELGEYRMHVGPLFGQPTSLAEPPLRRTLALDSVGHPEVRVHLTQLAFERGDFAAGRALMQPLLKSGDNGDRSQRNMRLLFMLTGASSENMQSMMQALRDAPAAASGRVARISFSSVGVIPSTRAIAESLAASAGSRDHQREGLSILMELNTAAHFFTDVEREGKQIATIDSLSAADAWGTIVQSPNVIVSPDIWRVAGNALEYAAKHDTTFTGARRLSQATLMAARTLDKQAYSRRLAALTARSPAANDNSQTLQSLRAFWAECSHDTAAFAREMRDVKGPVISQFVRWQKATWLAQTGNVEEAERWYLSTPWGSLSLLMTAASWEKASQLEARRGNSAEATVWSNRAARYLAIR